MAGTLKIYQGADKPLSIRHDYTSLSLATEIEIYIDTNPQIVKTLSAGDILNITATTADVTITAADTSNKDSGQYRIQGRITDATGQTLMARFSPQEITLIDTVFTPVE